MKRGLMGAALCMSAAALFLDGTAEKASAQNNEAIAKSKGWSINGVLNPAALQSPGNKPVMLVFR
jgi:hypothetical protein